MGRGVGGGESHSQKQLKKGRGDHPTKISILPTLSFCDSATTGALSFPDPPSFVSALSISIVRKEVHSLVCRNGKGGGGVGGARLDQCLAILTAKSVWLVLAG